MPLKEPVRHRGAIVTKQTIRFEYDTKAVWTRISGRRSVFLDSNAWIHMADGVDGTACRVRERLRTLVKSGQLFCPVSGGTLEELFLQAGPSLDRTAALMEELSLNACYVVRQEIFQWEFARSLARTMNAPFDKSLKGLYVAPAGYLGSCPVGSFDLPDDQILAPDVIANAQNCFRQHQATVGIAELAKLLSEPNVVKEPPSYSEAAKKAMLQFKGNKSKIFVAEAENCFIIYIRPLLKRFPQFAIQKWLEQFGSSGDEQWYRNALTELPALHNFVDLMVEADMQPARKDSNNHFLDNEIMTAPLAYADVFVTRDKGIRDLLRNRTAVLARTKCNYCDSLGALELWLEATLDMDTA